MRKILRHPNSHCYGCPLSKSSKNASVYIPTDVYYSDVDADDSPVVDVLVVGEPPSLSDDRVGFPFTGAAGVDLKAALSKAGIENYAVTNSVRCRCTDSSGKHRIPSVEEVAACKNYLLKDIELLQPKVIVLAGTLPVQMLGTDPSWKGKTAHSLKGRIHKSDNFTQVVTISPSFYLRSENAVERRRFFRNILAARRVLTGKETRWSKKGEVRLLTTLPEITECIDYFQHDCTAPIAMDTETRNLNMVAPNTLATMQLSSDPDLAYVIPIDHWDTPFKDKADRVRIKKKLNRLFSDPDSRFPFWVMHNYPFDIHKVLRHLKVKQQPPKLVIDTQFLAYIQDENQAGADDSEGSDASGGGYNAFRLKDLSRELLGFYEYDTNLSDAMAARSGASGGSLWDLPLDTLSTYGGTDAYVTLRLFYYYKRWLESQGYTSALKFARRWYGRAAYPLMKMSENGFYQDRDQLTYLRSPDSPILSRLQELPRLIYATQEAKEANKVLLGSDPRTKGMRPLFGKRPWALDIAKKSHRINLFVDACHLEPLSHGKDGSPGINKGYFDHYKEHPIIQMYKEYSGLYKLSTSYLNSVESLLVSKPDNIIDGRIRAGFHLIRTVTGRASCLPEGTPIATARGIIGIEEVVEGDLVQTHKGPAAVSSSFYSGEEEVLRFHLESGRSLECTGNHTVFVNGEWKLAKDIVVGDDMYHCSVEGPDVSTLCALSPLSATVGRTNKPSLPPLLTDRVAFLLGHFVAEGCVGYDNLRTTLSSPNRRGKVPAKAITALGCEEHTLREFLASEWKEVFDLDLIYDDRKTPVLNISSVDLCQWLILNGFSSKSRDAIVPECVLRSPVSVRKAFLRGLFEGDGGSTTGDTLLSTESLSLATAVCTLLTSLGVDCSLYHRKRPESESVKNVVQVSGGSHVSWIFWSNRKRAAQTSSPRSLGVRKPSWFDGSVLWNDLRSYYGFGTVPKASRSAVYTQLSRFVNVPSAQATALVASRILPALTKDTAESSFLRFSNSCNARSLSVKRIERAGVQKVYDLTVPSAEAFLVNGILCHNSSSPNLQQLPKGEKWTAKAHIRSLYGAPPGYMILEADYGQAEVRWWAQISGDKDYAKLFHEMKALRDLYKRTGDLAIGKKVKGEADIHKKVAGIMFNKSVYDVTKDDRKRAKSLCFACIFGQHFKTLAALLGITPDEALELQGTFLGEFGRAGGWLTDIEAQARQSGIVETPMGRVRHLADVYARNEGAGDRRARNSPIQAASSDTATLAAWRIQMMIEKERLPFKMINCVHDAITLEIPLDYDLLLKGVEVMNEGMVNIDAFLKEEFDIDMIVPMEIDFDIGVRWGHLLNFDGVEANLRPLFDKCVAWDARLVQGEKWHTIANQEWPVPEEN